MGINKQDLLTNGTIVVNNGIYKVAVQDDASLGGGLYTIGTASGYPAGANLNILFGGGSSSPATTYNTIRSYTTQTDYIQPTALVATDPGFTVMSLSPASTTVQTDTGIRTTYTLTSPVYPDNMTIVQDIIIHGTTFNDSTVEITTSVTNTGMAPLSIGIRYLWDYELDGDDGPTFQQLNPDGLVLTNETTFSPPGFESYIMENNSGTPIINIKGTANGPVSLVPQPTPPEKLQYAVWGLSFSVAFSYTTTGQSADGDCSVLYYWGSQNEIVIPVGATAKVSALLYQIVPPPRGISFWS